MTMERREDREAQRDAARGGTLVSQMEYLEYPGGIRPSYRYRIRMIVLLGLQRQPPFSSSFLFPQKPAMYEDYQADESLLIYPTASCRYQPLLLRVSAAVAARSDGTRVAGYNEDAFPESCRLVEF